MIRVESLHEILENFWDLKMSLNSSFKTLSEFKYSGFSTPADDIRIDHYAKILKIVQIEVSELIHDWNMNYDDEVFRLYFQ